MQTSLLDGMKIGILELNNRIVMPPMATGFSTLEGKVTSKLVEHYVKRADNLGLLIVEHSYVTLDGRLSPNQLAIHSDDQITGLRKLVEAVQAKGTPIALQINHAGGSTTKKVCGTQPLAPSPVVHPRRGGEQPRGIKVQEIEELIKAFGEAAKRALKAGFDAVEIHGAHGFLLNQFLSPLTNRRKDEFGGSLENRARFPLMVIDEVLDVVGDSPVLYRLGAEDTIEGGLTLRQGVDFSKMMARRGVSIIDVSGGLMGSSVEKVEAPGFFVPQAASVKEATGKPVIGVGGIKTAKEADAIIRSGKVDLVAVGRAILNDPKWASKALKSL
jgi:2,4-dienoyl-CoA reductase-like NADH-dependent reductase (Old Yellow Enzyme family)